MCLSPPNSTSWRFDFKQPWKKQWWTHCCDFYSTYQITHGAFGARKASKSYVSIRPLFQEEECCHPEHVIHIVPSYFSKVISHLLFWIFYHLFVYLVSHHWPWKSLQPHKPRISDFALRAESTSLTLEQQTSTMIGKGTIIVCQVFPMPFFFFCTYKSRHSRSRVSWAFINVLVCFKELGHTRGPCLDQQQPQTTVRHPAGDATVWGQVSVPIRCLSTVCPPRWRTLCLRSQSSTSSGQLYFRANVFDQETQGSKMCKRIWPKGPRPVLCFPSINGGKGKKKKSAGRREHGIECCLFFFFSSFRGELHKLSGAPLFNGLWSEGLT